VVEVVALAGALAHAGEHREAAECSTAMLRISSIRVTVLPTPAPPKRPTLPPLAMGMMRSMTLMPVSRISVEAAWSSSLGAGAVDRPALLGIDRAQLVHRVAEHVHDAPEGRFCRPGR
jgi:hypothetical protein